MKTAIASNSFRRSDLRIIVRPGDTVTGEDDYVDELVRSGLARNVQAFAGAQDVADPLGGGAVEQLRASQADQAAPLQTSKQRLLGDKLRGRGRGRS